MAARIMRLVVVHRASRNRVVKATDTMSATAGKTHSAHLHTAHSHSVGDTLGRSSPTQGVNSFYNTGRHVSNGQKDLAEEVDCTFIRPKRPRHWIELLQNMPNLG